VTRDVLLLLALPASGKSEIRRYLDHADPRGLGLGRSVHVDDYPYVHLMRRVSEELSSLGEPPPFFASGTGPFIDARDWSTLTLLLDEDVRTVLGEAPVPAPSTSGLFRRIDAARSEAGLEPAFASLHAGAADTLTHELGGEAARIATGVADAAAAWVAGETTLVAEFARGGPAGAALPLDPPRGYRHALSLLSPSVLRRAAVLYVWVTPEESRRRNAERARPGRDADASILHHGVPERVMREDYGCDDMGWLFDTAPAPHTIEVAVGGRRVRLPAACLDNRDDVTSHLRGDPSQWDPVACAELHRRLRDALRALGA
jgi:hypothetical protein